MVVFSSKHSARTEVELLAAERRAPVPQSPVERDSVAAANEHLIDRFVKLHTADVKRPTAEKYRSMLRELAAYHAGRSLCDLEEDDLRLFLLYLAEERPHLDPLGRPLPNVSPGLAASTRKGYVGALRLFYRKLRKWRLVDDDPTEELKTPRVKQKEGRTIGLDAIRALLTARGRPRCTIQAYLLVYTLARSDSIAGLRWRDVSFDNQRVYFDRAKGDDSYWVPMHPDLEAALHWWKQEQRKQARRYRPVAAALADPETAYVLLTREGLPVRKQTIAKQLDWRAARAGIELLPVPKGERRTRVSPHVIRRSMATIMRMQGQDVFDISAVLNHKDPATTLRHYAFGSDKAKRRAIERLSL
jgi:integrase/recombinase XerD